MDPDNGFAKVSPDVGPNSLCQPAKARYPLEDILFITLSGVAAGAGDWSEIRVYVDGHI